MEEDRVGAGRGRRGWEKNGDTTAGARTRRATHCIEWSGV